MRKNIILSPHCDDAAFSLGGLLLSGMIDNVVICTVFSISNCTYNDLEDSIENITTIRKKEDEEFFKQCKSKIHLHYMDKLDAPIRMGNEDLDVFNTSFTKKDREICTEIISFIEDNFSIDDIIYAPLALGNHIDHYILFEVAADLAAEGYDVNYYEDLPYAANCSNYLLKRRISSLEERIENVYSDLVRHSKISIIDKISALSIYRSQIDPSIIKRISNYHYRISNDFVCYKTWGKKR